MQLARECHTFSTLFYVRVLSIFDRNRGQLSEHATWLGLRSELAGERRRARAAPSPPTTYSDSRDRQAEQKYLKLFRQSRG